jgi:hypothetical protein
MRRAFLVASALAGLTAAWTGPASAQMYPGGFGGFGWGGWGMGGATAEGDIAHGLGAFAAGAGYYNQQTAIADSINTDTVIRWNQYWYNSQLEANRAQRERMARRQAGVATTREQIEKRLRDNPDQRDVERGDALNMAMDEINNPAVYKKALTSANVPVGGELIRNIPFQYASAAITTSFHQLASSPPPAPLTTPQFEGDRAELRDIRTQVRAQLDAGEEADAALIDRALKVIEGMEAKVAQSYQRNTPERTQSERYLKSLHGLVAMLKTPAVDILLSGVEKRPNASLADLLNFMHAFNLRFGAANTVEQRKAYTDLYPKLAKLRDDIAPVATAAKAPSTTGEEVGQFFSGMDIGDIQKRGKNVPTPPAPPVNR